MARKRGQNLTYEEKMHIVFKFQEGYSQRKISSSLKVARNTVADVLTKWRQTGGVKQRRGQGRPKKCTARDERILVRKSLANRRMTSSQLAGSVSSSISARTARRILLKYGLRGCIAAKKPLLTSKNRKARFQWAKRFRHWTASRWRKVLFSDESSFELFPSKFRIHIRRKIGEKYLDSCLQPTVKHGGGSIMVWGCIAYYGAGLLKECQGHIKAADYLSIIKSTMQELVEHIQFPDNKFIFQHDNAPVHTAKIVKTWLYKQNYPILPWPAQSPDMSPIETCWNDIKRKLQNARPSNKAELLRIIQDTWNGMGSDYFHKLIDSMPKRVNALYLAKGGHTKW